MEIENSAIQSKNKKLRWRIIGVFLAITLIFAGYGYYWFRGVIKLQQEATSVVNENSSLKEQAQKLEILRNAVRAEYNRCQEFISQQVGDFGSFEYCKKFIQWVSGQNLIVK